MTRITQVNKLNVYNNNKRKLISFHFYVEYKIIYIKKHTIEQKVIVSNYLLGYSICVCACNASFNGLWNGLLIRTQIKL